MAAEPTALATTSMHVAQRDPAQIIAMLERARLALSEVEEPREIAGFVNRVDMVRYLVVKAELSFELQNQAAVLAITARRRAGDLLADVIPHEGGRPEKLSSAGTVSLDELGITRNQSSQWQRLAAISDADFELWLADTQTRHRMPTMTDALRLGAALQNGHAAEDELEADEARYFVRHARGDLAEMDALVTHAQADCRGTGDDRLSRVADGPLQDIADAVRRVLELLR